MAKYTLKEIKPVKDSKHKVAIYNIEDEDNVFKISPAYHYQHVSVEERDEAFDIIIGRIKESTS